MSARRAAARAGRAVVLCLALAGCGEPGTPCPLCDAVQARDPAAVQRLLDGGEPVTAAALQAAADPAALAGRLRGSRPGPVDRAIAEALLARGDPNARWPVARGGSADRHGTSAGSGWRHDRLFAAALIETWPDPAMARRLLERGLDVRGAPGGEALRAAAIRRSPATARVLVEAGAPVDHVGLDASRRTTPLAEAIQALDTETIDLLERAGAREWVD